MWLQIAAQHAGELTAAHSQHAALTASLREENRVRLEDAKQRLHHVVRWGTRVLDRSMRTHAVRHAFTWWR